VANAVAQVVIAGDSRGNQSGFPVNVRKIDLIQDVICRILEKHRDEREAVRAPPSACLVPI